LDDRDTTHPLFDRPFSVSTAVGLLSVKCAVDDRLPMKRRLAWKDNKAVSPMGTWITADAEPLRRVLSTEDG